MKNDFREFYDVDYIMHSYTDDELMHWEWPAGVRKYIDKIRTASGKWRYIYENDIKPGVQKGINKGKQILKEDVDFYKDAIDKAKKHKRFKDYKKATQKENPVDWRNRSEVTNSLGVESERNRKLGHPQGSSYNRGAALQRQRAEQQRAELKKRQERAAMENKAYRAKKKQAHEAMNNVTNKLFGNSPKKGSVPYTGDTKALAAQRAAEQDRLDRLRWEKRNRSMNGHRGRRRG